MVWIVFSWQDFFGDFARHAVCATGQNVTNARPFSAFVPAAFDLMSGKTGDVLRVGRFEDDGYFCTIEVTATSTVTLDTLTEKHAEQENMTLTELKKVIADIYPGQTQFYVIEFKCL